MLNKTEEQNFNKLVGQLIKDARETSEVKQEVLANYLGFKSRVSVANIERGMQNIQLTTLVEIADYLKIPVASLIPPLEAIKRDVSKRFVKKIDKAGVADKDSQDRILDFIRLTASKK